jgi:hypothetical protein
MSAPVTRSRRSRPDAEQNDDASRSPSPALLDVLTLWCYSTPGLALKVMSWALLARLGACVTLPLHPRNRLPARTGVSVGQYRDMNMRYWLEYAQAELRVVV